MFNFFNKNTKPVTIITGYLGSGKTTLINEILKNANTQNTALIVNDMGSINIDAKLIKNTNCVESSIKLVELQNGCICCTLRDEFMLQIEELGKNPNVKRIIVEASGISDPASIADAFISYQEDNEERNGIYLDSIVSVADAEFLLNEFFADNKIKDTSEEDDDIITLVMDQVEFCNMIILNKCDLVSKDDLQKVKSLLKQIQNTAKIIECSYGKIDTKKIFNGKKFNYDKVLSSSSLQKALEREEKHGTKSSTNEHGFSSFIFEDKRPFDYKKFLSFLDNDFPQEIVRAKGYTWFSDDRDHVQLFEMAGHHSSILPVSTWLSEMEEDELNEMFKKFPSIKETWDETYGDRTTQMVFIGRSFNQNKILQDLKNCLAE